MKLVGIARAKNEADFIEYFARYNRRILDEIYIADDNSSDNTTEIIDALLNEGVVTELLRVNDRSMRIFNAQDEVITLLMNHAANKQINDECYIFALDADEILLGSKEDVVKELEKLKENEYGLISWKTFAPINGGLPTNRKQLCNAFRPLTAEQYEENKIVLCAKNAQESRIAMGNHSVHSESIDLIPRKTKIKLCHFPVRSARQIISKSLVATHKTQLKPHKVRNENYHMIALANRIRQARYKILDEQLTEIATSYLLPNGEARLDLEFDMKKAFPPIIMKYEPEMIEPISALDSLLEEITNQQLQQN